MMETTKTKTVAAVIVDRLAGAGVVTLFGMPGGGSNMDVIEAAADRGLPFVLSHTETAGALMAAAQAEITCRPGACLATLGPGVASIVNGTAHAFLDRVPLVVLTDRLPGSGSDGFQHQRLDHRALLAPVTRWSATLAPDTADEALAAALAAAMGPPPGPVHLDCAADVSATPAGGGERAGTTPAIGPSGGRPPVAAISPDTDRMLKRARKPLVIAGLGVRSESESSALRLLCERHGIPALATYKASGVVAHDHRLFAGTFTNGIIEAPVIREADLIIAVGLDPVELLAREWKYSQPVIYCSADGGRQRHVQVSAELIGDITATLAELDARLPAASEWRDADIRAHVKRQRVALKPRTGGFAPHRAIETLARALPADSRLTIDAGAHMVPAIGLWPARAPRQVLISNGLSTMGFALPAAIGAALLDRDKRTVALTGDGGLLMCAAELSTAAREKLKVLVVVFDDAALSLIKIKQDRRGYRPAGVEIGAIDWPALSAGMGVPGWRAANETELERCLAEAVACDGPALIAVRIDPCGYPDMLRAVRG
jgi:acetolactate synthase-1/2/3 large subunit